MKLESIVGQGTRLCAILNQIILIAYPGRYCRSNSTAYLLYPSINFLFYPIVNSRDFSISSAEIADALDGLPLNNPSVYPLVKELIASNLDELQISELS
jgi:hypothetical protein